MVAANMAASAPAQHSVRRYSAADMAAIAAQDIGRRNGMGRRCALKSAGCRHANACLWYTPVYQSSGVGWFFFSKLIKKLQHLRRVPAGTCRTRRRLWRSTAGSQGRCPRCKKPNQF